MASVCFNWHMNERQDYFQTHVYLIIVLEIKLNQSALLFRDNLPIFLRHNI